MKKYVYLGHVKYTKKQLNESILAILTSKTVSEKGIDGLAASTRKKLDLLISLRNGF